jgi:hypothetical protein
LSQTRLARLLSPLGIGPDNIGPEKARVRGYRREWFADAFARYLPEGGSELHRCTEAHEIRVSDISEPHSPKDGCADQEFKKSNNDGLLSTCAVRKGGAGGNGLAQGVWPGLSARALDQFTAEIAEWVSRQDAVPEDVLHCEIRDRLGRNGVPPELLDGDLRRVLQALTETWKAG